MAGIDATGKFAYVANYGSQCFGYSIDATSGELAAGGGSPFGAGNVPMDGSRSYE